VERRSLFDYIFKKPEPTGSPQGFFKTLTAYTPVFTTFSGSIYESELIRACIHARATHISKLRVTVQGSKHLKMLKEFEKAPNRFQTWGQFLYRLSTILDVQNNAFIVPVLNENEEMTGMFPLLPDRCELVQYSGEPWLRYTLKSGGKAAMELRRCGLMTKFQYQDDFFGESNKALYPTLDLINIQNQGIREAVKSSATYRFMAQIKNFSKPEDLAKERKRFSDENLSGEGGGLLLFPNTYTDVKQISGTPYVVDAEQMRSIKESVYTYTGTNDDVLQNKAFGDAWSAFYEGGVEPFAIQFSDVATNMLQANNPGNGAASIMATASRLQYMSNADKLNVSRDMADRGIMNRDEIREIWNLPPLPNGEGKAYTIRGEYYLLGGKKGEGDTK